VCFVSREAAVVFPEFLPLSGDSPQLTERIEAFELQSAVIAEKLMQPGKPENNQGIVVATLNAGALASGTPHTLAILSIPRIRGAIICRGAVKNAKLEQSRLTSSAINNSVRSLGLRPNSVGNGRFPIRARRKPDSAGLASIDAG
jgi:hypothetical protein